MIEPITDFVSRFNTRISLDQRLILRKKNHYFLIDDNLKRSVRKGFFYAGTYLGKTKNGKFFPSFSLLRLIAEQDANQIAVDEKTEWLFICGRDVFKRGIKKVKGSKRKGDYTLVLNQQGECLGFGKILRDLNEKIKNGVTIQNISDIGDFLRREKKD
ncbi:MAG: hypothetical protein OEY22_03930 [Candidatus Bathyarchaeota archaeon]|nr:hypothetical protein [Candidatus Bathyarchaeota archaeon]